MSRSIEGRAVASKAEGVPLSAECVNVFRVMGPPMLRRADGTFKAVSGTAAALIGMFVVEPALPRPRMAAMLWPRSPEKLARNNLRTLMHRIARECGHDVFSTGGTHVSTEGAWAPNGHDVDGLLQSIAERGPRHCELLADIGLEELPEFQAWLQNSRRRIRQAQLLSIKLAYEEAVARLDHTRTVLLAKAAVALEPLDETWHCRLMSAYASGGDRAAALAAYEDCKAMLWASSAARPAEETRSLHLRILRRDPKESPPSSRAGSRADLQLPLVEREAALELLRSCLGRGLNVQLHGEAGVGKTRLLRQFCSEAGIAPISLPSGLEREPFSALATVLRSMQQAYALRFDQEAFMELARIAPEAFPDLDPDAHPPMPARVDAALQEWAVRLSRAGISLLAIDDLHNADPASQSSLASLLSPAPAQRSRSVPIMIAHRTGELQAALHRAIAVNRSSGRMKEVCVNRLTREGVTALLAALGDAAPDEIDAIRLVNLTGGNPLLILELLQDEARGQEGATESHGIAGLGLQGMLQARLAGCSDLARELSYVAAIAKEDFSIDLAVSVTGRSREMLLFAKDELQSRGLFDDRALAHGLVTDAVLAVIPAAIAEAVRNEITTFLAKAASSTDLPPRADFPHSRSSQHRSSSA